MAACLAGAALLAGALAPKAFAQGDFGQGDEVALAVPRLASTDGVALPQPLAAADATVLRQLFASPARLVPARLRAEVGFDAAAPLNQAILGHVYAAGYLTKGARPQAAVLVAWLADYAALPDAAAIAALLRRRDPAAAIHLVPLIVAESAPNPVPAPGAGAPTWHRNPALDATLQARLAGGDADAALRLISRTKGLHGAYRAALLAEVAREQFAANQDESALALADEASVAGAGQVADAAYIGGLAAWRLGRPAAALARFAAAVRAPVGSGALHAAAAFWAGRAGYASGERASWAGWFATAAGHADTFYGLLAARALGEAPLPSPVLTEADVDAVAAEPGGLRAFALLQIGQTARADAELRLLADRTAARVGFARSLMLVAERAGLYDLAADLAGYPPQAGQGSEAAIPLLQPRRGFQMDPALIYALARVESRFDTGAVSRVGAEGLLQLMPATADAEAAGRAALHNPAVNLDLGQRYLLDLADAGAVDGDLIRLLASYNAGPAALGRMAGELRAFNDPLLFIEAIPMAETRHFVQQTLMFTWIYAARLGLPTPSLDALAAGHYPRFSPLRADAVTLH